MIKRIDTDEYFPMRERVPVIDTRTPAEFDKGHMPGAYNLPIFSDEERVRIGTTYKKEGREPAVLLGFDLVGPKWRRFIEEALRLAPYKKICVHCWRGGMRSSAMAWALDFYGFDVFVLEGGYKGFRNWVLAQFEKEYPLTILGGMTGSHKTRILHEMERTGCQMVDLEELARHHGSSYGTMNKMVQPTQQQFENDLAWRLRQLDRTIKIWIEDESRTIGRLAVPTALWEQMRRADLIELKLDIEQRIDFLAEEYGVLDKEFLIEATCRIEKRLGPQHAKSAVQAIREDRIRDFIRTVLVYYDKAYLSGLSKRNPDHIYPLEISFGSTSAVTQRVLDFSGKTERFREK